MLNKECSREAFRRMNRPITPNGRLVYKTRQAMREAALPTSGRNHPTAQRTAMILALAGCTAILIGFLPYIAQRTLTPQPEGPGQPAGYHNPGHHHRFCLCGFCCPAGGTQLHLEPAYG